MKSKLGGWLQSTLDVVRGKNKIPPYLPKRRHHALTPSASQEDLTQAPPFFSKLPPEIRHEILVLAFGDRTLHMDISFDHPMTPFPYWRASAWPHDYMKGPWKWEPDYRKPKRWHWRSSICHRCRPGRLEHSSHTIDEIYASEPDATDDQCLDGFGQNCEFWPGESPSKCLIGVMGWLLASRQAYVEGIAVLYGTNTFHISTEEFLGRLPQLLLPARLASISSLEIILPLELEQVEDQKFLPQLGLLETRLSLLRSTFPNIIRLYLALKTTIGLSSFLDYHTLLNTLDTFVTQSKLQHLRVTITGGSGRGLRYPWASRWLQKPVAKDFWPQEDGADGNGHWVVADNANERELEETLYMLRRNELGSSFR
ncbi:hypothetical protein CEP54_007853 [Fusarium duplospermum]|uniref:DUF7730 domain-containing protein n=1 Tax=Fusarium duplospermum TaxID=1325734 RepID=A0A428PZ33_9HYPO|nr:hypothetical protein CEP54_007853 [Fusarium duplospermum]